MYASMRRYTVSPGMEAEVARRVNRGFVPIISKGPGFVAYYLVDAGNGVVTSVSIFKDRSGAELSNAMAAQWVKHSIASLVDGAPEITAGTVTVHAAA